MSALDIKPVGLAGAFLITPKRHGDARGFFSEVWKRPLLEEAGVHIDFMQDNLSHSVLKGTVRGLHFQTAPFVQTKLVMVVRGRIFDAIVDLRRESPTFKRVFSVELSAEAGQQLLVPKGFAHGFCTVEPDTTVLYKVDAPYAPAHDTGIHYADPELAIAWPVRPGEAVLSAKDAALPPLRDALIQF